MKPRFLRYYIRDVFSFFRGDNTSCLGRTRRSRTLHPYICTHPCSDQSEALSLETELEGSNSFELDRGILISHITVPTLFSKYASAEPIIFARVFSSNKAARPTLPWPWSTFGDLIKGFVPISQSDFALLAGARMFWSVMISEKREDGCHKRKVSQQRE